MYTSTFFLYTNSTSRRRETLSTCTEKRDFLRYGGRGGSSGPRSLSGLRSPYRHHSRLSTFHFPLSTSPVIHLPPRVGTSVRVHFCCTYDTYSRGYNQVCTTANQVQVCATPSTNCENLRTGTTYFPTTQSTSLAASQQTKHLVDNATSPK